MEEDRKLIEITRKCCGDIFCNLARRSEFLLPSSSVRDDGSYDPIFGGKSTRLGKALRVGSWRAVCLVLQRNPCPLLSLLCVCMCACVCLCMCMCLCTQAYSKRIRIYAFVWEPGSLEIWNPIVIIQGEAGAGITFLLLLHKILLTAGAVFEFEAFYTQSICSRAAAIIPFNE